MKDLYMKLNSLVPHQKNSKVVMWALPEFLSLPDQLEEAANYIKKLQIDLERMRQRKESLTTGVNSKSKSSSTGRKERLSLPHMEIHSVVSALEEALITGLDYQYMFNDIIRILYEEGAEIINASYTVIGETMFHSIHSKVGECATSSGYGAARISEKLKQFVGATAS